MNERPVWLPGEGEMAERIRAHDWAATPLGPIESWPGELKLAASFVLENRFPAALVWGPGLVTLYNDAFRPILGEKSDALGRSFADIWSEAWHEIGPMVERAFAGESTFIEDYPLVIDRSAAPEQAFFTFSYSPVRSADGSVAGMIDTVVETTDKIRADQARREADERFRALLTTGANMIYRMSPDWRWMYALDGRGVLADTWEPVDNWADLYILPEDRALVEAAIDEAVRTRSPFELEHRVRLADGGVGWVLSRAVPMFGADGEVVEWFGAGSDVTERKQTDEVLHDGAERQRFLLRFSDALRAQPDEDAITNLALRMLADEMGLSRCYAAAMYPAEDRVDVTHEVRRPDLPPMPSPLRFSDFPEAGKQSLDRTLIFNDIANDPDLTDNDRRALAAMSFGALLSRALRNGQGRPIWAIGAVSVEPRRWTPGEVALVEEASERAWAAMERVRVEEALRESEERHRAELERQVRERTADLKQSRDLVQATMDSSMDMIQVFHAIRDEAGKIVDFKWVLNNHTSESRYGTIEGESLLQRNPGVVEEGIFDTFRRVTETGEPEQAERHYVHEQFDGWFLQTVVKLDDGVATTTKDITEWKAAQEEVLRLQEEVAQARLRETEERFRLIVENATDYAILVTDREGIITDWLPGAEAVFGWTAEEAIGRDAGIAFTPADQAEREPEKELETAAREGVAPDVRWHQRKDGSQVFIDGTVTPLRDGNGGITGFLKIGQDVTERRNAQEALEVGERRMRTLATGIPQLVFRSHGSGERIWGSPQWIDYTGLSFEESLGLGWLQAVHPDDREATMEAWEAAAERGEYYAEQRIGRVAGNAWRWHQTRAVPLRDEEGRILEWLGTSTDVEDMRQLQRHTQTLLAELQHRVRNTLAVIRSIARRTAETSGTVEEMAAHLAGRLDAFSRAQAMATRKAGSGVSLAALVEDELLAHAARQGEQLRIAGPDVCLKAKPAETISLAIHELATNAVKYGALSADGRVSVEWRREALDGGGERLALEWTESGMELDGAKPSRRGFGLELLERTLPYDLRAKTEVSLRPQGLRFTLDMPLDQDVLAE